MPPRKPKKGNQEVEPVDDFTPMPANDLQTQLNLLKEKVNDMRSKRNYIQMDRDMVEQFYSNTHKETDEVETKIRNKETEAEKLEDEHRVDVKVYLQKVKHLEYEQEISNQNIKTDGEGAKNNEDDYFKQRIEDMKKDKDRLKHQ